MALWEDTVLPLLGQLADALNAWLAPMFGAELRLAPDLDEIPALAPRRESVWERVGCAEFLTTDEKRAAVGYGPMPRETATEDGEDAPSPAFASSVTLGAGAGEGAPTAEQAIVLAGALKALADDDIDRAEALLEGLLAKGYPEFDPDQPRVPAGDPSGAGGQWSGGGGQWSGGGGLGGLQPISSQRWGRLRQGRGLGRLRVPPRKLGEVPRIDRPNFLLSQEGGPHGGHTYRLHIDITNKGMQQRFQKEPDLRKASKWNDEETAEKVIADMIRNNQGEIQEWLKSGQHSFTFRVQRDADIGVGYNRGDPTLHKRRGAVLTLQRDRKGGYAIVRAYPD